MKRSQYLVFVPVHRCNYPVVEEGDHALGFHFFTSIELEIAEVGDNLLGVHLSRLLKVFDTFRPLSLELFRDVFHISLQVGQVGLLIE